MTGAVEEIPYLGRADDTTILQALLRSHRR